MKRSSTRSLVVSVLLFTFAALSVQAPVHAAMMTTQEIAAQGELAAERTLLQERLLRDDVKGELLALGVNPADVESRINSLSAAELAKINGKLDALPAGGDGLGTVALVLLILILLEITGAIDIFPKL